MEIMVEVSVIIPTYNRQEKLQIAIESVLAQEQVPFELLVIDDGSDDGTKAMVRSRFPGVDYYAFPNRGPGAARNRGIERARGEWIAFLDSDDRWLPGKLKAQLDFFEQNPDYRICQTEETWIRNGRHVNPMKKHQKYGGWIFKQCLPLCIISPSAAMIHRSLFDEVGLFDESLPACEDYDLWLRISARYPIGLIPQAFIVKHGGHGDQRSKEFPAMDRFRIQSLVKLISSGILTRKQTDSAMAMLEKKSCIYIRGALKRNKENEAKQIETWISEAGVEFSQL